jgi:hypothetical protein
MWIEISLAVLAGVILMFLYGFIFEALGGEEAFVSEEQKQEIVEEWANERLQVYFDEENLKGRWD